MTLPNGLELMGKGAFAGCWRLESITTPFVGQNSVENSYLGYWFGANSYYENAASVPASLKQITITGDTVNDFAFFLCGDLERVVLSENVKNLGGSGYVVEKTGHVLEQYFLMDQDD